MYPGHFVRRDVAEEKRRQLIRQTNPELRQLEAKLRLAYVNKERAAQLEERKLEAEIRKRDKEVRNRVHTVHSGQIKGPFCTYTIPPLADIDFVH